MTLKEIGIKINGHLKRFEKDPSINKREHTGLSPYYCAGATQSGRFVYVTYVSFQNSSHLTRKQAEYYLDWLDSGNVGRHYEALKTKD